MNRDRCRLCRADADMTYILDGVEYRVCSAEMERSPAELDLKLKAKGEAKPL